MSKNMPVPSGGNPYGGKDFLKEFNKLYRKIVKSEYDSPDESDWVRHDRLRVSGFPYCGLKHVRKRLTCDDTDEGVELEEGLREGEKVTFGMKYYTSVGTQTHRYIQYAMGHSAQILGLWKCVTPKCPGANDLGYDNICPVCKRPRDYEELTVKRGKHLTGHIDGVWRAADGRYYIIDYKTSSVKAIRENHVTGFLPYKKNVAQIMAYCALVEKDFGIEISGWILMYVARDNPMVTTLPLGRLISRKAKAKILERIDTWDRHYGTVMSAKKWSQIETLIAEKPCKTYEEYMASAYHSGLGGCTLGISGVCFNAKRLRETLKEDWENRPSDWLERRRPPYLEGK